MRGVALLVLLGGCRQLFGFDEPSVVDAPAPGAQFVQEAYVKTSNSDPGDLVGSVALSADGSRLIVGVSKEDGLGSDPFSNGGPDTGALYVFERRGSGWGQVAYLKASNLDFDDNFGSSVAVSANGSTVVVGAIAEDGGDVGVNGVESDDTEVNAGAAYVFERDEEGAWNQIAYLKAANSQAADQFGQSVGISGDGNTIVVGAPFEDSGIGGDPADNSAIDAGAAYVFVRNGPSWELDAYLKTLDPDVQDLFGTPIAVSFDGNTLAIGATLEDGGVAGIPDDNSQLNSGAVYVFVRVDNAWQQQGYLKASNTDPEDHFGFPIALSGDGMRLVTCANAEAGNGVDPASNSVAASGACYVFDRAVDTWTEAAYLKSPANQLEDRFGTSLAMSGDGKRLVIGSNTEDGSAAGIDGAVDENLPQAGAVWIFEQSTDGAPVVTRYVKASNPGREDGFGVQVAMSADGTTFCVAAAGEDSDAREIDGDQGNDEAPESGAIYVFRLAP